MNSSARILILFAFFIAFIGQSFAIESVVCEMPMQDSPSMDHSNMKHDDMDHSSMGMQAMVHQAMDEDCCGAECQCPQSACTSFSYVGNQQQLQATNSISEKIVASASTLIHTTINLPFRPPISV